MNLLRIDCSITQGESVSRRLSDRFVSKWCGTHPSTVVDHLDLVRDPLPHFNFSNLAGMVVPTAAQTEEMRVANDLAERLISQLERADVLVIGCPMYNFTIPTQLKAWLDHVTRAGRTFSYTGPSASIGLLKKRPVIIIEARGGEYLDPRGSAGDYQEPLLRHWLGFLGLTDVHFVRAEGLKIDLAQVPFIIQRAEDRMVSLVEEARSQVAGRSR